MKKQYIFLAFIGIILYLLFLIVTYKYKELNTNYYIDSLVEKNNNIQKEIEIKQKLYEYYNTNAYKNKILKEEHGWKNENEVVINITTQNDYDKFTSNDIIEETSSTSTIKKETKVYENMTNYQKWIYFIFNKDIR